MADETSQSVIQYLGNAGFEAGVLDLASGTTSLVGAGLAAARVGAAQGPALLVGAGLCDL